ncbi:MAG: hypothetical protein IKQ54_05310 [Oscillospiraceae bacterium]|nr:hypothetical protein [Oscillospiraceae bacterium]
MKRLLGLLPMFLFLCGCSVFAANSPHPEPARPAVLEMSPPVVILPPISDETVPSAIAEDTTEETTPVTSEQTEPGAEPYIEQTEPPTPAIPYQIGDTTPTWRPELEKNYPQDSDCDAEQLLEKWMTVEGLTMADLDARDCRQLILVSAQPSDGVTTLTVCYERSADGAFHPVAGLDRLQGFVGKNGIMHDRRRDSNSSPAGLWAIGTAFGNEAPPENLKLPWRQVTPNSDWVCDENSPYFNTWQERDDPELLPWSDDVEHLEDYPTQYAWACVIEFNRPPDVVPDRGCAIFLHCAKTGTGGCVGLRREDMYSVLQWLDPDKKPYILITSAERP